jgi:hypothetical protein
MYLDFLEDCDLNAETYSTIQACVSILNSVTCIFWYKLLFHRIYIVYYKLLTLRSVDVPTRSPRVAINAGTRNTFIFVDCRQTLPRHLDDPIYTKIISLNCNTEKNCQIKLNSFQFLPKLPVAVN